MIKFGPSGNSASFYAKGYKSTTQAPEFLNQLGLNAYEYSFGRGVLLGEDTAKKIAQNAQAYGVEISVHAPYFINLANEEPAMIEKSIGYVLQSLEKLQYLGGNRCVVHPATQGKSERQEAAKRMYQNAEYLLKCIEDKGLTGYVCFETMGKIRQMGNLEEIIELCKISDRFIPCIDFGHLNSRLQGALMHDPGEYRRILDAIGNVLGLETLKKIHIHFSKIAYSAGGEVRHLTFSDLQYGPNFEPLLDVIAEYRMEPFIICESAETMAEDALCMKQYFESIQSKKAIEMGKI